MLMRSKPNIAIVGEDLTRKMVIPLIHDGVEYSYNLFGKDNKIPADQRESESAKTSSAGHYRYACEKGEAER